MFPPFNSLAFTTLVCWLPNHFFPNWCSQECCNSNMCAPLSLKWSYGRNDISSAVPSTPEHNHILIKDPVKSTLVPDHKATWHYIFIIENEITQGPACSVMSTVPAPWKTPTQSQGFYSTFPQRNEVDLQLAWCQGSPRPAFMKSTSTRTQARLPIGWWMVGWWFAQGTSPPACHFSFDLLLLHIMN